MESAVRGHGGKNPQWVQKDTATAILAVDAATALSRPAGEWVPALGARRRLQALVTDGWPMGSLAEKLGTAPTTVSYLIRQRAMIPAALHQRVVELFDQLQTTPGPSAYARRYGRSQRWAPPTRWDEEDPDAPQAAVVQGSCSTTRAGVPA
ncbi:hypothetical protein [Nocardia sp. NBC_01388]|uniref:hypothetical protein n=1 Tax=Nocardia sp. NBC_01388 TaxID=2903596 RepID=UPI003246B134